MKQTLTAIKCTETSTFCSQSDSKPKEGGGVHLEYICETSKYKYTTYYNIVVRSEAVYDEGKYNHTNHASNYSQGQSSAQFFDVCF